jgi:hypothetical protein
MPSLREAMIRYSRFVGATLTLPDNWQALIETAFDPNGYAAYVVPNETRINALVNPIMSKIWSGQTAAAVGLQQIHEAVDALLQEEI